MIIIIIIITWNQITFCKQMIIIRNSFLNCV